MGCILAELMLMIEDNCPYVNHRKALFPGNSSYPLSPNSAQNPEVQSDDQLKMIFKVIGTPSESEINSYKTKQVKQYLHKFRTRHPINLERMFPVSPKEHINLLLN